MKKILYIILDGLSDLPLKELNNQTPLESAATPVLDRLAQQGTTGLVYPVARDIAPESDISVMSMLGYDAGHYYTGRGPLESFAAGLDVKDGNLALRVNFATVSDDARTLIDRRVARTLTTDEAAALAKEINSKVSLSSATFEFKNTVGHRGVLVIRGMHHRLSAWISDTDPAYERQGVFGAARKQFENTLLESRPLAGYENSAEAVEGAVLLNEFTRKSYKVLSESSVNKNREAQKQLPANIILLRDAGDHLPHFASIEGLYNIKFGCFVEMPLERGIALLTGMEIIDIPSSTGHLDVDYAIWAKVALDALAKYNGIFVHIKGPDDPGHDGDFMRKREIIETIDKFFFSSLLSGLNIRDTVIAVTADHTTACSRKSHSNDPVPLLICGGTIKPDGSVGFSEKAARGGSLGELKGQDVMSLLVKLARQ